MQLGWVHKIEERDMIEKAKLHNQSNKINGLFEYLKVGQLNDHMLNIIKAEDRTLEFHMHNNSDEMLYLIDGKMEIEFADGKTHLETGDLLLYQKALCTALSALSLSLVY